MQNTINFLLAILYALIGLCMAIAGIETLRDKTNKARIGTAIFWFFLAIIFAFGDWIPARGSGFSGLSERQTGNCRCIPGRNHSSRQRFPWFRAGRE